MTNLFDKLLIYLYLNERIVDSIRNFAQTQILESQYSLELRHSYPAKDLNLGDEAAEKSEKRFQITKMAIINVNVRLNRLGRRSELTIELSNDDRFPADLEINFNFLHKIEFSRLFGLEIKFKYLIINGLQIAGVTRIYDHFGDLKTDVFEISTPILRFEQGEVQIHHHGIENIGFTDCKKVEVKHDVFLDKIKGGIRNKSGQQLNIDTIPNTSVYFYGRTDKAILKGVFRKIEINTDDCSSIEMNESSISSLKVYNSIIKKIVLRESLIDSFQIQNVGYHNESSEIYLSKNSIGSLTILEQKVSQKEGVTFKLNNENFHKDLTLQTSLVEWSFDGISDEDVYSENKRRFLNLFKSFYQEQQNTFQSQMFNALEKKWYQSFYKYDFSLFMSSISNNFGLSLALPLLWIGLLVFSQTFLMILLAEDCRPILLENWGIFLNILNPTHTSSLFIEFLSNCSPSVTYKNWIYLIDNINRILVGYMIFQFAVAFRYKFRLR